MLREPIALLVDKELSLSARESEDNGKPGERNHTGEESRGDHTDPDVAVLPVEVGDHAGGAAHHVAVDPNIIFIDTIPM